MKRPLMGIMALYLNESKQLEERAFFAKLISAGEKLGLDAYVFTPQDTDSGRKQILAHCYEPLNKRWVRKWMPFPDVIFDRCRYQPTKRFEQLQRFRSKYPQLLYMNRPLANKWVIYQLFDRTPSLQKYLPDTALYKEHHPLVKLLQRKKTVYIKPINGTGGRGIIRVDQIGTGRYLVQGRTMARRIMHSRKVGDTGLSALLAPIRKQGNYIMQEGIDTKLSNGRVHDFRALVQKNGSGSWQVTGIAGRVGPSGSITSNLHGGGKAAPLEELLQLRFGSNQKIESIRENIQDFCLTVVRELEAKYRDLCELALDIAIDRHGGIWLLEINPKPAREVFARIGKHTTYQTAIKRPLEYALWLVQQKQK